MRLWVFVGLLLLTWFILLKILPDTNETKTKPQFKEAYSPGKCILTHNSVRERDTEQVTCIKNQRKSTQKHQMHSPAAAF